MPRGVSAGSGCVACYPCEIARRLSDRVDGILVGWSRLPVRGIECRPEIVCRELDSRDLFILPGDARRPRPSRAAAACTDTVSQGILATLAPSLRTRKYIDRRA
jgi:hypothetical protein